MNLTRKNGRRPTIAELSEATQVDAKKIPLLLRGSSDDLSARWERLRKRKQMPQGALNRLGEEFIVSNAEMIWNLANGYVYEPGSDELLSVEDAALATWDAFCTWEDNGETTFPAWARRLVDRTYPRRRRSRDEQPDPDLLEPSAYDHICSYLWGLIRDRRLTPAPRNLGIQR
jgi:hypothetical protein